MSSILFELDRLDFEQNKQPLISVGELIRKYTFGIHKEFSKNNWRVKKKYLLNSINLLRLSISKNIQNKKNTISETIKSLNRAIKKYTKLIKN